MKSISNIFIILVLFILFGKLFAVDLFEIEKIVEDAKSVVLLDYNTKCIVYAKNPSLVFPPASLTKLVTIYTALIEARKKI